jgi:hypothetical protein
MKRKEKVQDHLYIITPSLTSKPADEEEEELLLLSSSSNNPSNFRALHPLSTAVTANKSQCKTSTSN